MPMKYNDESVSEIAAKYALLRDSLEKLRDARKDKVGAVLAYVSGHYENAERAVEFLQSAPPALRERLKLRELETELNGFGNVMLKL